jgi:hypothetical protein
MTRTDVSLGGQILFCLISIKPCSGRSHSTPVLFRVPPELAAETQRHQT